MTKENQIQAQIYQWYNNNFCLTTHEPRGLIFAVPNGGTRNVIEAMTMKVTGTLSGVSDLIVIKPNREILFIEVKIETGKQSEKQKDFEKRINNLGYKYHVVRSLNDFKAII